MSEDFDDFVGGLQNQMTVKQFQKQIEKASPEDARRETK